MGASNSYSHLSSRRGHLLVGGAHTGNQSQKTEMKRMTLSAPLDPSVPETRPAPGFLLT